MIKKQSLAKNYIYQFLYQMLILVIPLVLSPYLTRVLGEKALGIYSYADSIASYFLVIAMLGISRHGQRLISENSDDSIKLRKAFWSLFTVHIIISLIALLFYIGFVIVAVADDKDIFLIETLYVFSALFDITWLFYGLENFRSVVIKNALIKVFQCLSIFAFVKNINDLGIYTLIMSLGILLGQIVMIPQAMKLVKPIRFTWDDAKVHIKPLFVFSVSVIASFLYTVFDKTLLGFMSVKENVAFYEYSNKIISIPKTVIGVTGTVMFPRACRLAAAGDVDGQKRYIYYSYLISAAIGMASMFGLLSIADLFAVVYFGDSFRICGTVMMCMSPLVCIVGVGDVIRTQYMIPNHMDKQFNICILMNAVINLVLTILLIPRLGIFGAVVGSVSAEFFGLIYQLVLCKKFLHVKDIIREFFPFAIIGSIMMFILRTLRNTLPYSAIGLLLLIFIGGSLYIVMSVMYILVCKKEIRISLLKKLGRYGK